jgi:dipeptidyl aminopeptidase/acylaminoacyl peptidase
MKVWRNRARGCAVILCLGAWSQTPAAAPLIPLETFAAGAEMEAPRISPGGTHLAYIATVKGERVLAIRDLKGDPVARPVVKLTSGTFSGTHCDFKNDNRLLCHFSGLERNFGERSYPSSRLVAIDRDGSHLKVLSQQRFAGDAYDGSPQFQDRIVHFLPDDPKHVLIEMADAGSVFPAVYELDIDGGTRRTVVSAHAPVLNWIADRDGVVRFGYGYHDQRYGFRDTSALYIARNGAKDPWRTLEKFKRFEGARFVPLAFGPLPNQLFVSAPQEKREAVWQMDLEENRDFQLVFSRPDVDADSIITWPTDQHVIGFEYETDRPHIQYIDSLAAGVEALMEKTAPDAVHRIIDASRDGKMLLVESYSDVAPPFYHLLNFNEHQLLAIGYESSALAHAQLAPMKAVTIPGPGGVSLPGYLTLPVGATPGEHRPAVVYPHGGPYARDSWGYDPMVQVMANRGYAVLQVNFRGSTGYGEAWQKAGHQAWGTVMHDDITAGARWLIAQGIADPGRLCIVGWSYGGYAALIGVVKEPQLYRCAVAIAGVSDLSQLARQDDRFYGGFEAAKDSTGDDKALLQAESPVLHADRVKVPVLLVHGEEDFTVQVDQSQAMAKALTRSGVKNELVVIQDGEHSLLRPDMRLTLYRKLTEFLGAKLGAPAPPDTAPKAP